MYMIGMFVVALVAICAMSFYIVVGVLLAITPKGVDGIGRAPAPRKGNVSKDRFKAFMLPKSRKDWGIH